MLQARAELRNHAGAGNGSWCSQIECQRSLLTPSTSAACLPQLRRGFLSVSGAPPRGLCGISRRASARPRRRGGLSTHAAYEPYAFREEDYYKCVLICGVTA